MKKRNLIFLILGLIIFGTVLYLIFGKTQVIECQVDADCVPSSCCHADSCVPISEAQNCEGIFCSAVCSGPLDCGAGSCGCVKNKCGVIKNE